MKNYYKLLLASLLTVLSLNTNAQNPVLDWAKSMGGTSFDEEASMTVDASGNIYTCGYFYDTADFDPGSGTYNLTSKGSADIFIQKLDSSGNFIWAKSMGGSSFDIGNSIAVDASGNVYTTGRYVGTADFDPGSSIYNLTAVGFTDFFIQKLDSNGNFIWAKSMGGNSFDIGYSIAVDASGNIYTTGYFDDTVDFDPGSGIYNLTSTGNADIFIEKLDSNGNFIWAKSMGGNSSATGFSIAVDNFSNIYTTGYFSDTVDFDPSSSTHYLSSTGSFDIFIEKLDSNGNFIWAKSMGGRNWDEGNSIAIGASGNVYTTGSFQDTVDFDPDSGNYNLTAVGNLDIYIQKLDSNGNFIWAKSMGGCSIDAGICITVDDSDNVYTTGIFDSTAVDFDPGSGTYNLSCAGIQDIFIQKLDSSGNFIWAISEGGPYYDAGRAIDVDSSGNIYTSGVYDNTVDFDPGSGTYNLTSAGSSDIFIQKFKILTGLGLPANTNNQPTMDIMPNPNKGSFTFEINGLTPSNKSARIEVFNTIGKRVYSAEVATMNEIRVPMDLKLAKGMYIIRISTEEALFDSKFIVY